MKSFKQVFLILLLCLNHAFGQFPNAATELLPITKLTLVEFDRVENDYMTKLIKETLKNGSPTKEFSQELTDIAQKEADRLSSIERLEFPLVDLSAKKYYGFSREMVGKVQINNGKYKIKFI